MRHVLGVKTSAQILVEAGKRGLIREGEQK
jgi:hypothetical protein